MSAPPDLLLFGGTFDPVHNAHLEIARAAADEVHAPQVLFIPAANPPHKQHGPMASFFHRARMLQLACSRDPRFQVSFIEENTARSFSIDTIEKLRDKGSLGFLIGADAFAEIETWHRWRDVVAAVEFVVVSRPGASFRIPDGARVHEVSGLRMEESSSAVRAAIARGDANIPVPEGVLDWILQNGLYQSHAMKISQTHSSPST